MENYLRNAFDLIWGRLLFKSHVWILSRNLFEDEWKALYLLTGR